MVVDGKVNYSKGKTQVHFDKSDVLRLNTLRIELQHLVFSNTPALHLPQHY